MQSTILSLTLSTSFEVLILVTDSPLNTAPSFRNLIPGITSPVPLVSVLLPKIGRMITTGCVHAPVCLTIKVVSHMKVCNPVGTLIVPLRKSAHFWTAICSDGLLWSSFVHDWVILPDLPNLFIRGKAKNSIFGAGPLAFSLVALRIGFSIPPRKFPPLFLTYFLFHSVSALSIMG